MTDEFMDADPGEMAKLRRAIERWTAQGPTLLSRAQMDAFQPYWELGYENVLVVRGASPGTAFAILQGWKGNPNRIMCLWWDGSAWAAYSGPLVRWLKALLPEVK